jgi:hypothetical protein
MRPIDICVAWVVYRMTRPKQAVSGNVVCEQAEWEAIESAQPGYHTLLYSGIKTEQEAEKLARGTAGDDYGRGSGKKPVRAATAPPVAPAPKTEL